MPGSTLEFRILGPLEVRAEGVPLRVAGRRQRILLAVLLLKANRPVSRSELIECVLDGGAADPEHALRIQVSRLRKVLKAGDEPRLSATDGGYQLRVEPGELDADQFEQFVQRGCAALAADQVSDAVDLFRHAESLWRGAPLADVELEGARGDLDSLEERYLAAVEDRIDAELELGRHADRVAELEALVAAHPFRERLRAQQMLALYRCGRQADALAAYRQARKQLLGELGLNPGEALREIEQAILRQDPGLALPERGVPPTTARRQPRRLLPIGVALVSLAIAAIVAGALSLRQDTVTAAPFASNGLVLVSAQGRAVASIKLSAAAKGLAYGFGSVWAAEPDAGVVERVDPDTRTVRQTIAVGDGPSAVARGAGALWVVASLDGLVERIDPTTNRVVQRISVGGLPSAIAVSDDTLWITDRTNGTLLRVSTKRGRVEQKITVGRGPSCVIAAIRSLWVCNRDDGTVARIDPRTGTVVNLVPAGDAPSAAVSAGRRLWVLDDLDATTSLINTAANRVAETFPVGGAPDAGALDHGALWIADGSTGRLTRIDAQSGREQEAVRVGSQADAVVATRGGVWVAVAAGGTAHRGGTLRGTTEWGSLDSVDPAYGLHGSPLELANLTNDGLTGFDHASGAAGARLVPDLAVSLPLPVDDGRVYTFTLRRGIRYSTGALVRPLDVRRSIERSLSLPGDARSFLSAIEGARSCIEHRGCDLTRGIAIDPRAHTVTFRLTRPDPNFLYELAEPPAYVVPADTPIRVAQTPLPATGPYVIASFRAEGPHIRLVRNRYFREWSRAAQPQGYPGVIRWDPPPNSVAADAPGRMHDLVVSLGAPHGLSSLLTRSPSLVRVNSLPLTQFDWLNTRAKPFDDVRVRRALNYAIDRRRIAGFWGGRYSAAPTCQLLPPQLPGYGRYCPYTVHPQKAGKWIAPDLRKARSLIDASHTAGMRIEVWTTPDPPPGEREDRYVAQVLRRLGYRVTLHIARGYNPAAFHAQVVTGGWSADYPAASTFLGKFACSYFTPADTAHTVDLSEVCDRSLDRRIEATEALQQNDLAAASRAWARIDRELTDRAYWLPGVNFKDVDVVGRRVGNYQFNLLWGPIVDQLWVR
jgi:ABC-type transport system substrate-binding protein/DNA-binding SARP family transcriptional activator/DNA-binding beta-propeller fold protein YncE